jgi:hypothetical protein
VAARGSGAAGRGIPFRARFGSEAMSAPTGASNAPAAAKVPTLLDALARAPAAAALVVTALERTEDRAALRLVHSQLGVGEATTELGADFLEVGAEGL